MISRNKVRFGIIGAGSIAQAYGTSFGNASNATLVAACDIRPEVASAMADAIGCQPYSDISAMCEDARPAAVVVCTPPSTHPAICEQLMDQGIHVLCEKPLAIDSESARQMIDAAERNDVLFTMASKFRYVDDVIKAKALIESGLLGDTILFENCFTGVVDMSSRWNSNPDVSGGGVLIDNGTHSVDIMRYLLGPIAELQVVEGRRIQKLPVEDTARMFVRTADGVMGSIDLSWSMTKEAPTYINIYGSQGTLLIGWKESKYRRTSDDEWVVFGNGYDKLLAFQSQIENFAAAIRGHEELLITPADGLASVEVIETAYRAMERHRWEPVGCNADCSPEFV